jgi:hypothetical protein
MELRTSPRSAVAIAGPFAGPTADISDSHDALAKGDRLDVAAVGRGTPEQAVVRNETPEHAAVRSETPAQAVLVDESIAAPENNDIAPSELPRPTARHNPKSKKIRTAIRPRPKPGAIILKRRTRRSKVASDTEPCRLKAFGGLRQALNTADCEI